MIQLSNNETTKFEFVGSLNSIDIVVDTIHETDNTAIDGADIDLSQMYITITDLSDKSNVYSGQVKPFCLGLAPNAHWTTAILNEVGTVYDSLGASDAEKRVIAMPLMLQMTGAFSIDFRVNNVFGADVDASSKVSIATNKTTEIFDETPRFELIDVPASTSSLNKQLGDNVFYIGLIDLTAPSGQTDSYPWNISTFSSDLETREFRIQELKAISSTFDETLIENGANLTLHSGEVVSNVGLSLQLTAGNVVAGDQFVLVGRKTISPRVVNAIESRYIKRGAQMRASMVK